jgi:hypothetical protein
MVKNRILQAKFTVFNKQKKTNKKKHTNAYMSPDLSLRPVVRPAQISLSSRVFVTVLVPFIYDVVASHVKY